jgi:hypothetical protein
LLKKWEDNKAKYNMMHFDPHKNKKKNGEENVWVLTCGGAKIGRDFEHGEGSGQ